jgi:hypothetical protein
MTSASAHTAQTTANNSDQATKWGPLVARIRQGDREAVGELYQEVFPRLRFYLINRSLKYDQNLKPANVKSTTCAYFFVTEQAISATC